MRAKGYIVCILCIVLLIGSLFIYSFPSQAAAAETTVSITEEEARKLVDNEYNFLFTIRYQMGLAGYNLFNGNNYVVKSCTAEKAEISVTLIYYISGSNREIVENHTAVLDFKPWSADVVCYQGSGSYFASSETQYYLHLIGGTLYDLIYSKISEDDLKDTPSSKQNTALSDAEAWEKIANAYRLLIDTRSHSSYIRGQKNSEIYNKYNTVGKMSEYSRTLFVNSIADMSWRYDYGIFELCWGYNLSPDTEIYPCASLHMGSHSFKLYKSAVDYSMPTAKEAELKKISEENGIIEYQILMYSGDEECEIARPGYLTVRFMNTDDGWRIANCPFFAAISCGSSTDKTVGLKWKSGYCSLGYEQAARAGKKLVKEGTYAFGTASDYQLEYPNERFACEANIIYFGPGTAKAIYRVQKRNTQGEWEEFGYYDAILKNKDGEWVITGGGLYDLANGVENVAPYTADDNNLVLYLAFIPITLVLTCIVIKKRYY